MVNPQIKTFNRRPDNCLQHLLLQLKNSTSYCAQNQKSIINHLNCAERRIVADILLDICKDCTNMAALPHGAFAACKLRIQDDRNLTISRMKSAGDKGDEKNNFENKKQMEYSPVKYNGKLMNAIWGHYNRYSPHNMKGNEYESSSKDYYVQQHIAVASFAIAQNMTMAIESGNEWCFADK